MEELHVFSRLCMQNIDIEVSLQTIRIHQMKKHCISL